MDYSVTNNNKFNNFNVTKINFLVTLLFIGIAIFGISQEKIEVSIIDKETKLSVPFATIHLYEQLTNKRITTDENGKYFIENLSLDSIKITFPSYKVFVLDKNGIYRNSKLLVELAPKVKEMEVAHVSNKTNPALKIIKKVIQNNASNDFLKYDKYQYENYSKTIYDIKSDTLQPVLDSLDYGKKRYSNLKALMISESLIHVKHLDAKNESKILAQKTSGMTSSFVSNLLTTVFQHHISFYPNAISIIQLPTIGNKTMVNYLSPVCSEAITGYNYFLQETIFAERDTIFIIEFTPKKHSKFNGLKGILQVNSQGYAIQSIIVEPSLESVISFKLKQDYALITDKWFPSTLSGELCFKEFSYGKNAFPVLKIYAKNSKVNFSSEIKSSEFQIQKTIVDDFLISKSDSLLSLYRPIQLTKRELNTFKIVDSIGKTKRSDYWMYFLPKLMNGKIPISFIDLDLKSIYARNRYEDYRVGINVLTNEKLSSKIVMGGFLSYGVNDKKYKYGSNFSLILNEKRYLFLTYSYQQNLKEVGKNCTNYSLTPSVNDYLRSFVAENFDMCTENKIELTGKPIRFVKFSVGLSMQNIQPILSNFGFLKANKSFYSVNEIQVGLDYNYKEELMTIGNQRRINFVGNPQIKLNYYRGVSFNRTSDITYSKIESVINYVFYKGRIGQTNIKLCGGYIDKIVPVSFMFTGDGIKSNLGKWVIFDYFQTMGANEFVSSSYVNLFFRHNFGDLLVQYKKFKPQINIIQNTGWGIIQKNDPSSILYNQKNKIYLESGLVLNNIIKVKLFNLAYAGLGFGVFYRYGYYHKTNLEDNFTFKLSYLYSLR